MPKKRWHVLLAVVMVASLALAACGGAEEAPAVDAEAEARIAELEAALAEAEAGAASEDEIAALQSELESLQGELTEATEQKCTYNAYRLAWIMDWADAGNMVDTVFGPTSDFQYTFWQLTNYEDAVEFSNLAEQAYRETDPQVRAGLWQQAEDILIEKLGVVAPVYFYDRTTLVQTYVDYEFPPFGAPKFATWSMEDSTEFRTTVGASVPTLDPAKSTDTTSNLIIYQLMDAPFRYNGEGLVEPLAAESYTLSEDQTVYTVNLRQDATWSDGEPVTAQHFVDGVTRLMSPDMANDYAYVMLDIVGAEAYYNGEADSIEGLAVVDDYTFTVTLKEALSYFENILAFGTFHPTRLDLIEANPDDWNKAGNFVGNGAFVLSEQTPGANLVLTKNENYWNAANVAFESINIDVIEEPATSLAAFEAGELDWIGEAGFPTEDTSRLFETDEFVIAPYPGVFYIGMNTFIAPTDNLDFRKALSYSIDKRAVLDVVLELPWRETAERVIPPGIPGYREGMESTFDLAQAQEHLAAYMASAGIDDPGSIVLEVWYNEGGANDDLFEYFQSTWQQELGIEVRLVNYEWGTYLDLLEECNALGGGGF